MSDAPIDPMQELVEEYALGMLDDSRRAEFETRLRDDVALQRELAAVTETLGELALSAPVSPTPQLKDRVMSAIATPAAPARTTVLPFAAPRKARTPIWLGAALAASLMLIAKLTFDLRNAEQAAQLAESTTADGTRALAQRDSLIAQLTDPAAEQVTLAATGVAKPRIRAYFNHAGHTMLLSASLLETLPAGRAYQLWFIVNGKPVPSVTFTADSTGRALLRNVALPAGEVAAAAITQEPAGGSAAPTSPVLFVGKLATE